jgi:ATP-dependent protease ClpP protease subunit
MIASLSILLGSHCARAEGVFRPDNTLIIDQAIAGETMGPIMERMSVLLTSRKVLPELNIIIDSPGGSVYTGFRFIVQMKALQARGTKINCYVPGLAASMAFQVLTQCDKRVVLQESALLWHRARILIFLSAVTAPAASALARDLQQVDSYILSEVKAVLSKDMSEEDISYHFEHETMHIGQSLCTAAPHFCTAESSVPGLLEALANKNVMHTNQEKASFTGKDSMIYMPAKFLNKVMKGK